MNSNDAQETFFQSRSVDRLNRWFEGLGGGAYHYRWAVLLLCAVLLCCGAWAASRVRFDNSFKSYFDQNDPAYKAFLEFREVFGSDEISYILYHAPDAAHGIWNLEVMEKIRDLTRRLKETVPFVKEVTSLANAEFVEGVEGELLVHDILEDFPETQPDLLAIRQKILNKPIYINGLISRDGKYGAILVEMEKASVDALEEIRFDPGKGDALENLYPQVTYDRIETILAMPEYEGIRFYHTGDVPLNASYNRISQQESTRLGIISFAVIGVVLLFFFRSFRGVAGPLVVVLCAMLASVGFMAVLSWDMDLMFIMLPALLVAVGVADAVHLLSEFNIYFRKYGDRKAAVQKALFLVGVPCLFTSLTTMAGFASMSISPIKAIKHFAIYSAVGVGAAFLLSITLLVVFLSFGRAKKRPDTRDGKARTTRFAVAFLSGVARFNIRHKKMVITVFGVIFVISLAGMTRLQVDSNFITEFSKKAPIRQVTEHVDSVMGGSTSFSYVFDSGTPDGVTAPAFLKRIEALQRAAENKPVVMKAYSVVDMIKDINREFHNGDPSYYRIPDTQESAAQLLLVYEMSGGEELDDYLSGDFQKARLELRCQAVATSQYKSMVDELDRFLLASGGAKENLPVLAGMGTLWLTLLDYITKSQIIGFLVAFSVIAGMMCVVLGSVRVGLLSMVPNLTPVVITLGLMGWADIPLDYVKLLIASIAIGIAVDDTVHMVIRYRHEFARHCNYQEALSAAMLGVGRALLVTSVVLVAGFLVFTDSIMQTLFDFGILVACTIAVALLADFFLLPSLVLVLKPFGREEA